VLGYEYGGSSIVARDDAPFRAAAPSRITTIQLAPGDSRANGSDDVVSYRPTAAPGSRLPHAWLPDGTSLYDQLGTGYTLLRLGPSDPAPFVRSAAACGMPLALADMDGVLPAQAYGAPLVLVRPDQHVAWRGSSESSSPDDIIDLARGCATPPATTGYR
jgi:hypothetical protein